MKCIGFQLPNLIRRFFRFQPTSGWRAIVQLPAIKGSGAVLVDPDFGRVLDFDWQLI